MTTTHFRLAYPPSVNRYWRHVNGRTLLSRDGRAYRAAAIGVTDERFGERPVKVSIAAFPPDRRRRDIDNICKAVLDAIGHAGIYADDSQVVQLNVTKHDPEPPGHVRVMITTKVGNGCQQKQT